ncbi:hypothetical protein BV96_01059 [Sphingomonas paucimobilis]|nr:hypothetical protein BV96_01059 [Sphingomonas paucimobilis]
MTNTRMSRAAAIAAKCRDCIFDPLARGTWREQVAACEGGHCALHPVRPVPRSCIVNGEIHRPSIAAIRRKLDEPQWSHRK